MSLLVDDEKHPDITWDTRMAKIIPEDFVLDDEYITAHATVRDMLSHRSGVGGHGLTVATLKHKNMKEQTRSMRNLEVTTEIRTTWDYCNHGYFAVSHVIETLSGKGLGDFMKEKLWDPIGMKQTFFSMADTNKYVSENKEVAFSKAYLWNEEKKESILIPNWDDTAISGAGCMISNVIDYAAWIKSFIEQSGPLSAAGYAAVTAPNISADAQWNNRVTGILNYGMGWFMAVYRGERIIWHGGGTNAFCALMIFLPDKKFGVVGMVNTAKMVPLTAPMYHLIDDFLGVPEAERADDGIAKYVSLFHFGCVTC